MIVTNRLSIETFCLEKFCFLLFAFFTSITASATVIMIEPDDYAENDILSSVSPYVTLVGINGADIVATALEHDFSAPTGKLSFGSHPHLGEPGSDGSCFRGFESNTNGICHIGFGMFFTQPVDWVSLLALNYAYSPDLPAYWEAYDKSGVKIATGDSRGETYGNLGQPFNVKVSVPNMTSLLIGGGTGIDAMEFDRLMFKVPESSSFYLLASGLIGFSYYRLRKRAHSSSGEVGG